MGKRVMNLKNIMCFVLFFAIIFGTINIIAAAAKKKTKYATHSTTTISATATYYTHETTRWSISKPSLYKVSGKGGAASKSGSTKTSKKDSVYTAKQDYKISATDYNYNTTSDTRTITWKYNASSDKWVN